MNDIFDGEKMLTTEEFNSMNISERYRWFREHGYVQWPESDYAKLIRNKTMRAERITKKNVDNRDFRE